MTNHKVKCSNFEIANNKPFILIAGPCQLENESHAMKISTELKKITFDLMQEEVKTHKTSTKVFDDLKDGNVTLIPNKKTNDTIDVSQNLSLFQQEKILIEKALDKHKGKRKYAAKELGISERTLYRKIKEFDL